MRNKLFSLAKIANDNGADGVSSNVVAFWRDGSRALIEKATGIDIEKARAIHFTGPAKPWLGLDKLRATELGQPYFEAYRKWRGVYSTMLGPLANAESPGEI